jgi:predicted HD phosphohydrolase
MRSLQRRTGEPAGARAAARRWHRQAGAAEPLVAAALLHDLGHLVNDRASTPTRRGVDDLHQFHGAHYLKPLFGARCSSRSACTWRPSATCARPARATRTRCRRIRKRSLALQGGVFDDAQARHFEALPHALDAVRLRRWDDSAKCAGAKTPSLAHYALHMQAAMERA